MMGRGEGGVKRGESMKELKALWEETNEFVDKREKEIAIEKYREIHEYKRAGS
jgi:hypothetical protein